MGSERIGFLGFSLEDELRQVGHIHDLKLVAIERFVLTDAEIEAAGGDVYTAKAVCCTEALP